MLFVEQKNKSPFLKRRRNQKWKIPHSFREMNLVLQLVLKSQIKSKTDELELAKE